VKKYKKETHITFLHNMIWNSRRWAYEIKSRCLLISIFFDKFLQKSTKWPTLGKVVKDISAWVQFDCKTIASQQNP